MEGGFVIVQMGAVGSANFNQLCPGLFHDIRNAESAANLDQLGAGDENFLASCQGGERQQNGCGVVVDHQCSLSTCNSCEQCFDVSLTLATHTSFEVVLEGTVPHGHIQHRLACS